MTNTNTANPVTELREAKLGLSKAAFCRLTGCSYQDLTKTEGGYLQRMPRRICAILARYGVSNADEQYLRWRESLRDAGRATTSSGRETGGLDG